MIELVFVPAGIGRYVATLDGKLIGKPTRQPFFSAARVLLALGYDPAAELTARHRGSTTIVMRSTVGEAAKWMIDRGGLRKVPWKPRPPTPWAPGTAVTVSAVLEPVLTASAVLEALP